MSEYKSDAQVLFPSMVQAAPAVPSVEAKPTTETLTPAQPSAPDATMKAAPVQPEALNHVSAEVLTFQEQQAREWEELTRITWVDEVKSDPEIGGEKYDGAVQDAKRFLARFGDEELRQFLDATGFGNSKYVIRLLARAKRGMNGPGGEVKPRTTAQVLFPSMPNP